MTEYAEDIARWFQVNAGKLIWLTIVLAIVFVADRVISRVLRKILDNSQIPSASIFVNLTRVTIWVTGTAMVLQPVFGINPTTLFTAMKGADTVLPAPGRRRRRPGATFGEKEMTPPAMSAA